MALSYDSLQALVQKKYMKVLYDNIFEKRHYLTKMLKDKAKTYNGRKIFVPLEYGDYSTGGTQVAATAVHGTYTAAATDPFTAAEWTPEMITGFFKFSKEEELMVGDSERVVEKIVSAKIKNLQKSIEKYFATKLWARSVGSNEWDNIDQLVHVGNTAGGIAVADASWWKSKNIRAATDLNSSTPVTEANLLDNDHACYIGKLLARGVAKARAQTGENPDVITCPQYIFDLIEQELDPRKTGSRMHEKAGSMGFSALDYRGIAIMADEDMVPPQSDAQDGRMYFLNLDYLYMFFNSAAKFTLDKFVPLSNENAQVAKVHAYGNLVISNRAAQCSVTEVPSPTDYTS
mgnify:CR=1 FL=1